MSAGGQGQQPAVEAGAGRHTEGEVVPVAERPVTVRLLGLQAATVAESRRFHDAVTREVELMAKGADDTGVDRSALEQQLAAMRDIYATFRPLLEEQVAALLESGQTEGDAEVVVPLGLARKAREANEVFDWLEAQCDAGTLLTAHPPSLASGNRRWFFEQFIEQSEGRPPVRWPEWWSVHGDGSAPTPPAPADPQAGPADPQVGQADAQVGEADRQADTAEPQVRTVDPAELIALRLERARRTVGAGSPEQAAAAVDDVVDEVGRILLPWVDRLVPGGDDVVAEAAERQQRLLAVRRRASEAAGSAAGSAEGSASELADALGEWASWVESAVVAPLLEHLDDRGRDDIGRALEEAVQSRDEAEEPVPARDVGLAPGG